MTTQDLIARLEGAGEGSREIDALIWRALEPEQVDSICGFRGLIYAGHRYDKAEKAEYIRMMAGISAPPFTTSLDAALALAERVLPEMFWSLGFLPDAEDPAWEEHHHNFAALHPYLHVSDPRDALGYGATPALALCIAILRAHTARSAEPAKEAVAS